MPEYRTTSCRGHGHPEFCITAGPAEAVVFYEPDVRWLLNTLEAMVAGGERFAAGETFQLGWAVTEVRAAGDELTLWESDMTHLPVKRVEGVSYALAHFRRQKDVGESVLALADLSFASMNQAALVCSRLGPSANVVMRRYHPTGPADSGWFCGCADAGHDHDDDRELRRVSLYEAALRHAPRIVSYLALPEGVLFEVGDDPPCVFRHGRPLAFKPGSYLALKYRDR